MLFSIIFIIITLFTTGAIVALAWLSYKKGNSIGKDLCYTCLGAAAVNLFYLLSVLTDQYFLMSLFTSLYCASIVVMLCCLLDFIYHYTTHKDVSDSLIIRKTILCCAGIDVLLFLINPFKEIILHYEFRHEGIASYAFQMTPLYQLHLAFTYILVVLSLYRLIEKITKTPSVYRKQYMLSVFGVIAVVLYNAVFLFSARSSVFDFLDYSIWGYSFCCFFFYWNCFSYSTHGMLNYFRNWILESVNQGIVLFDYDDLLLAKNENAAALFPDCSFEEQSTLSQFLQECHIRPESIISNVKQSFQCFKRNGDGFSPVRCDYQPLKSDSGELIGRLFVFTDTNYEMDLLTGFHSWDYFQKAIESSENQNYQVPITTAICDINGLQNINDTLGRNIGDRAIAILAGIMKQTFPSGTYFIRGNEASLIALCFGKQDEASVQEVLKEVQKKFNANSDLGCSLDIQSAVSQIDPEHPDVITAVHIAERGMKAKKLMDKNSSHSELMTSLICALQESDNDTEAHVQRTQIMGSKLAKRMGLTDLQQGNLSLLCILHDIGKIGIPLDILNKPGKLTDAEWAVLKTHVEKGYLIVKSSQELSDIAEMVRHHHERWDGKGYPDGLRGEETPLLSRVISVVDAYDAMVNDRSYRAARSNEEAIQELKRCSGTQFDPMIVAEFVALLEEDKSIQALARRKQISGEQTENERISTYSEQNVTQGRIHTIHPVKFCRYIVDDNNAIVYADDMFESLTGYSHEDYQKHTLTQADLIFPSERSDYFRLVSEQLGKQSVAFFEHRLRRKDGSALYVFCYGKLFYDSAERSSRSEIIISDSSSTYSMRAIINEEFNKMQSNLEQIDQKNRCDTLTELLTREAFQHDVTDKLLLQDKKALMLVMDLDNFSDFNKTYGYHSGDRFLIRVAQALQATLRKSDHACRLSGDRFGTILFYDAVVPDSLMLDRAQQICDKLNMTLAQHEEHTSLSVGAAISNTNLNTFQSLNHAADQALSQAKQNGGSCLSVYSE